MVVAEYLIVILAQSLYNQVMVHCEGTKVTFQCLKLVTCSVTVFVVNYLTCRTQKGDKQRDNLTSLVLFCKM